MSDSRPLAVLDRQDDLAEHEFKTPSKCINDGEDLTFFFSSVAYRDLLKWLLQLNRAMFPAKRTASHGSPETQTGVVLTTSSHVSKLKALIDDLANLIEHAPPDTGPRRFGNVAFRRWFQLVEERSPELLRSHLEGVISSSLLGKSGSRSPLLDELQSYLLGAFGSAQRLDYGTGHELSFLAFLGCLWRLGAFEIGEERAIVLVVIQCYLELVRKLILMYTLEPAGSHGVWGLDDHSFLPYIFGSAQMGPAIDHSDYSMPVPTEGSLGSAPLPSLVTNKTIVAEYKDTNMYFSAIQFIYDVKKGPFWEHSPVLYDISGIKDGWGKINKGMLKMYAAEVLGKFPVVQHFPFGSLFEWKRDPDALRSTQSVHAQEQPTAAGTRSVPAAAGAGTAAPWAKAGSSVLPQMHNSTGIPSGRAPWAGVTAPRRPSPASIPVMNSASDTTITAARPGRSNNAAGDSASMAAPPTR